MHPIRVQESDLLERKGHLTALYYCLAMSARKSERERERERRGDGDRERQRLGGIVEKERKNVGMYRLRGEEREGGEEERWRDKEERQKRKRSTCHD